jgi:hypothetical protein
MTPRRTGAPLPKSRPLWVPAFSLVMEPTVIELPQKPT